MSQLHTRISRLEAATAPDARPYQPNPQLTPEGNAHFARIHDMVEGLGQNGLDALLADIAVNGRRLVPELQA